MKHIMGNTPRCDECYFYTAKSEHEKDNWFDGWCQQKNNVKDCWHKREGRVKTNANSRCRYWKDAEEGQSMREWMRRQRDETTLTT